MTKINILITKHEALYVRVYAGVCTGDEKSFFHEDELSHEKCLFVECGKNITKTQTTHENFSSENVLIVYQLLYLIRILSRYSIYS